MHYAVCFRGIFETGCLLHFERVHISSEQHSVSGRTSFENGDDGRKLFPCCDLEIEIAQRLDDRALRARECEAYLRMPVDLAPEPDDLR